MQSTNVYVQVFMYVCAHVHAHILTYKYLCMCAHVYAHMLENMRNAVDKRVCASMYVCIYV